jgi:hypothetical protein
LNVPEFDDSFEKEPPEAAVTGEFELVLTELTPTDPPPFEPAEPVGKNTPPPKTVGEGLETAVWVLSEVLVWLAS